MMSKKLVRLEVGSLDGAHSEEGGHFEKPVMMVYTGKFKSMDGDVEITDEDVEKLAANHNSILSKLKRMASGDIPLRHSPPLQLDHSTSARDTVGRLVGELSIGEHTTDDGEKKKALMGKVRFLGADNIERVKDGRWTHVSIGADLENHKISELSITPFPAAADASLLRAHRLGSPKREYEYRNFTYYIKDTGEGKGQFEAGIQWDSGSGWYDEKAFDTEADAVHHAKKCIDKEISLHPDEYKLSNGVKSPSKLATKLSSEETNMGYKDLKEKMEMYGKCKKHLMDEKKMSEEDADKHLEGAPDEELSKMAEEEDAKMKHLAEEEEKKKADDEKKKGEELSRMSAMKEHKTKLIELSKSMKAAGGRVVLAEKAAKISGRLARLKSEMKITPAEVAVLKATELAEKSDEVIEATLSSYEKREPVIDTGLYGSTKALSPSQLSGHLKKMNMEREELQTRLNMPSKAEDARKRLNELDEKEKMYAEQRPLSAEPVVEDKMAGFEEMFAHMKKLEAEGKHDEAKEHLRKHMTSVQSMQAEGAPASDPTQSMSALASDFKTMQTKFEELVKLAAPAFGATTEELG